MEEKGIGSTGIIPLLFLQVVVWQLWQRLVMGIGEMENGFIMIPAAVM